jgi:uncharacterized hydrophobic protein (TIGR00271 family)
MRIVEGHLPDGKSWRTLVILAAGEDLGITWQLGLSLAKANNGEQITAIIVPPDDGARLEEALASLSRIRERSNDSDTVFTVLVEASRFEKAVHDLIKEAEIDLLLARADSPNLAYLERMPCALVAVRGEIYRPAVAEEDGEEPQLERFEGRILVPTSGGPNTVQALTILLPLTNHGVDITALYIAPEHLGPNEEALGRARLRQTLDFVEAQDRIETKLISTPSIIDGIVSEASEDYDLVVIGASKESSVDKILFGDITGSVVRQSKKPVAVYRQATSRTGAIFTDLAWMMQRIIPRLDKQERTQAYVRIRRDARPNLDFYVLIALSAAIAALGMLANSTAVVIGAMLVAPLMSPIAGTGLAMVQGDMRFLRLSLGAVMYGSLVVLFMGLLAGFIPMDEPFTEQVLARTSPTMLDLGVALFSGMAVAFALTRSSALAALPGVSIAAALVPPLAASGIAFAHGSPRDGLGALLLYLTNIIAISVASALVFLVLGFRPLPMRKDRREARTRSAQAAVILLIIIAVILAYTTARLAQESAFDANVHQVASEGVAEILGAELDDMTLEQLDDGSILIDIDVHSAEPVDEQAAADLQEYLSTQMEEDVHLRLTVIGIEEYEVAPSQENSA